MLRSITGKFKGRGLALDLLFDFVGCMLYSVGVQSLSSPYNVPPGGITAIAMMINYLTGLPLSLLSLLINIPILLLGVFFVGGQFTLKSIKSTFILSITLELALRFVPAYHGDIMLASIFAGVLQGAGLALIFMRGSSTGGVDILSKIIQKKWPYLSMGRIIFVLDVVILAIVAVVYKSLGSAMYSMIIVFVASKVIDSIIFGLERGHLIMVVSEKHEEMAQIIASEAGRGSTLLQGVGTYTGKERPVLLCAISTPEFSHIRRIIYAIDPNAFVMSLETDEVLGEGFKPL